ncbi:hypothetical protein MMC28_006163 [Mycoblastus sanguinarius]|nr:hypothetical protein [Mycoblastus sanguinarius]
MDATQSSLGSPPGPKTRLAIIERFWNKRVLNDRLDTYGAYFRYYELESKRLYLGVSKRDPDHGALAATTHEDITFVVTALSKGRNSRRREIRQTLQSRFPHSDDLAIDESINLALRLWLMLNVLDDHQNVHLKQTPAIQWNEQATLKLDHDFTALNLVRYSGIEIRWTSSLQDHLSLERKHHRRFLKIYPFKQCLLDHIASAEGHPPNSVANQGPIIPATVLKETLLSLDFLFPHWDPRTDSFLCREGKSFHYQSPFDDPRPLNLDDFDHWRERLSELYQVYQSPPVGWVQIWADRRNPLQWYTFWLALVILMLTIVFGVIQSVAGIMQASLAYQSLQLARSQVNSRVLPNL